MQHLLCVTSFWSVAIRERPLDFYGEGEWEEYFGPGIFFFARRSLAFYFFLRGTVLDFFSQDQKIISYKR